MGHGPNLPCKEFESKSRIGHYGDKIMEGDHDVGRVLDALKEAKIDDSTMVVFASDNGPTGDEFKNWGALGVSERGSSDPFRGRLGVPTEGSIRIFALTPWPGHVKPDSESYAMFSIMDFMPTSPRFSDRNYPATVQLTRWTRPEC